VRFSADRIFDDINYSLSADFVAICRWIKESHFSRVRKMPLSKLLLSILHRRGTTLSIELRRFMELTDPGETISKPGYLKQRLKLSAEAILALCDFHNASLYREEDMQTINGYLVLASDGSSINVPTTQETLTEYGSHCREGAKPQASLGLSCLYDVINKVILCCTINRVKFDEPSQAKLHIERITAIIGDRKTIITLDRGYPSISLFFSWLSENQKFVIRLKNSDFKRERKRMESDDEWLDIVIDKTRIHHYKGTEMYDMLEQAGVIRLRVVNIQLGGGAQVSVATNLEQSEFSTNDISRLYSLRWNIETAFDMLKNQLEMENFTGTKPILIEQDIFACIYLCNLVQDMIADAQIKLDSSDKPPGKHKMVINRAYAVGVMKDEFIRALLESDIDKRTAMFTGMVNEIQKQVLPVRPGRHFNRNKSLLSGKYSNTHKRCY
jgi:hypothetical protein